MNFKQTRQDVDTVCFMVKKHVKTHSVQMFSRPPKTTLQIWPTDIFLQSVNMLVVCPPGCSRARQCVMAILFGNKLHWFELQCLTYKFFFLNVFILTNTKFNYAVTHPLFNDMSQNLSLLHLQS